MATFAERLSEAIEIRGMTKNRLASIVGVNRSAISAYCKGRFEANADNLYRIALALNVSEAWLMGIDGAEMMRVESMPKDAATLVRIYKLLSDRDRVKLMAYAYQLEDNCGKL